MVMYCSEICPTSVQKMIMKLNHQKESAKEENYLFTDKAVEIS